MVEEMRQVKMKNDRDEDSLERIMEQEEGKMREVNEMEKEVFVLLIFLLYKQKCISLNFCEFNSYLLIFLHYLFL